MPETVIHEWFEAPELVVPPMAPPPPDDADELRRVATYIRDRGWTAIFEKTAVTLERIADRLEGAASRMPCSECGQAPLAEVHAP